MPFKYRLLIDGIWNYANNGIELDRLVTELLRRGTPESEVEVEVISA